MTLARITNRDISRDWKLKDMTWTMDTCDWKDHLPWKFDEYLTTTTYGSGKKGFHQQYGRFRCKFQMQKGWCFWLLQLEKHRYCEVDHFELFRKSCSLTTWRNPHFNSQHGVPEQRYMNPEYEKKIPYKRDIYSRVKFYNKAVRRYILEKPRRYEIVWRKRFILWKVDGWPVAIMFRHIPKQAMFVLVSGPKPDEIEELEVRF